MCFQNSLAAVAILVYDLALFELRFEAFYAESQLMNSSLIIGVPKGGVLFHAVKMSKCFHRNKTAKDLPKNWNIASLFFILDNL